MAEGAPIHRSFSGFGVAVTHTTNGAPMKETLGGGMPFIQVASGGLPVNIVDMSPGALFLNNEQGFWYDPADFSTLFQDAAGTTPVTAVDQVVGLMLDKSGNGFHASQATTANKPLLQQDASGRYYLLFDGVDDWLQTSAIDFTATDEMSLFAGVRKSSDASRGVIAELAAGAATAGKFTLTGPDFAAQASYGVILNGATTNTFYQAITFTAPITNVIAANLDISGATRAANIALRVNAAANATGGGGSNTGIGGGNFGSHILYIGRRGGTTLPFNGRLYGLAAVGRLATAAEIARNEAWMNNRTGAY